MANIETDGEVLLAENHSALEVLHALLKEVTDAFPDALSGAGLPTNTKTFRRTYPEVLPLFEAARLASPQRHAIALYLARALQNHIVWQDNSGRSLLHDALTASVPALPLKMHTFAGEPGWQPSFVYQGERWQATQLAELGAQLVNRNVITADAGDALAWIGNDVLDEGVLRLSGRKIAVLGAGAEMAPTRLWLEAGADVLWLDTQPPPQSWWETQGMSGRLFWPEGSVDLLKNPQAVLATLMSFAEGMPLDLGLYAYAPGQAREMRLTMSMNALINVLPTDLVASVTMLVSPTTPTELSPLDRAAMGARLAARPRWEGVCAGVGLLGRGQGSVAFGDAATTRTVVAIQGASYQAAQYLGKIMMAEVWSHHGQLSVADPQPLRVSANSAAITRTRSLNHPVFAAAFGGAAAFGVETLTPRQSRRLNGLLAVHDWLCPTPSVPGKIRVHGGIHTLPYPLDAALRVAAAIGFARNPRLIRGLFGKTGTA